VDIAFIKIFGEDKMDESQVCFTLLVVDEDGDILMPSEVDGEVKLLPCPLILSKTDYEEADIKKPEELDQLVDELAEEFLGTEEDSEEESDSEPSEEEDDDDDDDDDDVEKVASKANDEDDSDEEDEEDDDEEE
jgi:hypothetical protein